MRPVTALLAFAILAPGLATFAQPAPIPPGAPRPASPAPGPMRPPVPRAPSAPPAAASANPQPTLLQVDVFQVETTLDRAAAFELGNIGQNKPARTEILRRLNEFGTARLVMRFDSKVNLNTPITFHSGSRMPVIQDITISAAGQATPSVSYTNIGTILNINGSWREHQPGTADLILKFELSGVGKTNVEVSSGVRLPSFNTLKVEQFFTLESGRPVLIMTSDLPEPGDDKGKTVLTILSIMAKRLDDPAQTRPAEEASAGQQTLVHAEIVELTAKDRNLDVEEIEEQLSAGDTIEKDLDALKKFGDVEVLSRPTILVNWPEEAEIKVAEQVPVTEMVRSNTGTPEPKAGYRDIGIHLKVNGHWLDVTDRARAEVALNVRRQSMEKVPLDHTRHLGSRPNAVTLVSQVWDRTLSVEAAKPVWVTSKWATPAKGNKDVLVLVRLTMHRSA